MQCIRNNDLVYNANANANDDNNDDKDEDDDYLPATKKTKEKAS